MLENFDQVPQGADVQSFFCIACSLFIFFKVFPFSFYFLSVILAFFFFLLFSETTLAFLVVAGSGSCLKVHYHIPGFAWIKRKLMLLELKQKCFDLNVPLIHWDVIDWDYSFIFSYKFRIWIIHYVFNSSLIITFNRIQRRINISTTQLFDIDLLYLSERKSAPN